MPYHIYHHGSLEVTPPLTEEDAERVEDFLNERKRAEFAPETAIGKSIAENEFTLYTGLLTVSEDRQSLLPEEDESREGIEEWLKLLVTHVLAPAGYSLSGHIVWDGEEYFDKGTIYVRDNRIEVVNDVIVEPGPSWDRNFYSDPELVQAIRALLDSAALHTDITSVVDAELLLNLRRYLPPVQTPPQSASTPTDGEEVPPL